MPPLRDRIAPGVRVLFVGINPGIRSAETGHHFAGYSNRFWKLLFDSKLVPEPIDYGHDPTLIRSNLEHDPERRIERQASWSRGLRELQRAARR